LYNVVNSSGKWQGGGARAVAFIQNSLDTGNEHKNLQENAAGFQVLLAVICGRYDFEYVSGTATPPDLSYSLTFLLVRFCKLLSKDVTIDAQTSH
jgi:hypothetical protein